MEKSYSYSAFVPKGAERKKRGAKDTLLIFRGKCQSCACLLSKLQGIKGTKMTDPQTDNENNDSKAPETEAAEAGPAEAKEASAEKRLAELEKQLAEMKDRALREMAEAENTRRRAQKEREETAKYAVTGFAKEMLGIADNFHRALEAAPCDHADPAVKNLVVGIDATERQLVAALERFGIKKIDPMGQPFDPNFHRVMMEVESADKPVGTVVQVLQAGYMIHDRLLREALVAVAKGCEAPQPHVDTEA
jgi:molecular chaperone GrpE